MTYLQIQTELDAVMEKLKTLPGYCQKPEDRKVLNRMYDLVELKNSAPLVDERGNYIEPCGCIEARVLDDGHYCDTVLNGTGAE